MSLFGDLEKGNEFCRSMSVPMDSKTTMKVKKIYEKHAKSNPYIHGNPLTKASELRLDHMVRGFIECARQTNTILHTGNAGEFQEFLGCRDVEGKTALHWAAYNKDVMLVRFLLDASPDLLLSGDYDGNTPLSLLDQPEYDEAIFAALEIVTRAEVDAPGASVISIDHEQHDVSEPEKSSLLGFTRLEMRLLGSSEKQELIVYNEIAMDQTSYMLSDKKKSLNKLNLGELELSQNKNTILHIAAMLGDMKYVKDILQKHPSLIQFRNLEGETPTYVAAREGQWEVIEMIIIYLKIKHNDIVKHLTRSKDNETALLTAIRNHHARVVFFLTKEVPALANCINDFDESPLYVAALKGYDAILKLILNKCKEIAYGGPHGKTALHAASISGSPDCILHLLRSKPGLLYAQDDHGWTALYYAVHFGHSSTAKALVTEDPNIGYHINSRDDLNVTPIHTAASRGHCETMKVLIDECPGCQDITNSTGRNILHVAIGTEKCEVIEFIVNLGSLSRRLINQKDNDGNTPIHLLVASNLEMMKIITDPTVDLTALNNEKQTPLDMASSDEKRDKLLQAITNKPSSDPSPNLNAKVVLKAFGISDNVVLVATLITTATFAAGFTVPGGFDGNKGSKQGMPILLRKSAFQAFVVSNALAFSCSCAVLLGHIKLLIHRFNIDEVDEERVLKRLNVMYCLVSIAMVAMAIAFITGMYVVLTPILGLAIYVCAICIIITVFSLFFASEIGDFIDELTNHVLDLLKRNE